MEESDLRVETPAYRRQALRRAGPEPSIVQGRHGLQSMEPNQSLSDNRRSGAKTSVIAMAIRRTNSKDTDYDNCDLRP